MKKTLLNASSNAILLKKTTSFRYLLLALTFWLGVFQETNAQCIGPYQGYESVPSSVAIMQANGWTFSGTTSFVHNTTAALVRTGIYSIRQSTNSTTNASVISPLIMTPSSFSFYIKGATAGTTLYSFQFSDDGGTTWYTIAAGTNNVTTALNTISVTGVIPAMSTTWQEAKVTAAFPATAQGYKFRVNDLRINPTNGSVCLDDFAWTSSVAADNNKIVPLLSGATACPVTLDVTRTYYFYDVGGDSDTYSGAQANSVYFTPSNTTYKIKATYETFGTDAVASTDYLQLFTDNTYTTQLGTNLFGASLPPVYTSVDANGALFYKFTSNAGAALAAQTGFRIKLECVDCSAPTSLAFAATGSISHDSAYLTWAGTAPNYDIYHSTSATAPTSGTTPTATSATTSATVTGLTASTTYYFWVRSNCGGSTSTWLGPISATSLCTPQTVVYTENFNGLLGGVLPTCTSTDGAFASNATNGNIFSNGIGDSFYTQGVTLTAGTLYRITYDYSTNLNGYASLDVNIGHPTNNTAPSVSNISNSIAYNAFFSVINSNIVNYTPSVTGTYYLRFFVDDLEDPSVQLNIDNIRIEVETCLPPTYPGSPVSGIGDTVATLNWNTPATGAPSGGYAYFISTSNTPPGYNDAGTGTVATNGITLTGLSANTTYYVWVRANCGAQISIWTIAYASFTTTNLSTPTVIRISDLTTPYTVGCGTSNITFTDSAGSAGNYANNERTGNPTYAPYSYTFTPGTPGAKLMVIFNSFDTENNWDGLMIYSGTSSAGTLMPSGRAAGFLPQTCPADAWSGTTSPGSILSTAADGSLTFEFRSDPSVIRSGWTASILCVANVPTITSFTPTTNNCTPGVTVVITGTNFVGITGVTFGGVPATFVVNNSTTITATLPATAASGKIRITTVQLGVSSATDFTVLAPPPTTTGASICTGGSGSISSSTSCNGYSSATTSIAGGWVVGSDPVAPKPVGSANSTTCAFTATNHTYTALNFQVAVTGTYVFELTSGVDAMAYITTGAFTAGSCATGTFVIGDDDSGPGLEPRLTVTLTAGVTYTIYTTFYSNSITTSYLWTIIPPSGGSVLLYAAQQIQWYTAASGGSPIFSGSPFNPVGVPGSGLADTNTPGTTVYYAACSSNSTCRTATNFVIGGAVPGTASSDQNVCSGVAADLTLTGNTGSVVKWQYASDLAFTVGVTDIAASASNTLTSAQIGTFTGARYFRAVVNLAGCSDVYSNVVTITFSKAIWNGSAWSNGTGPTATIGADFQGNFTSSVHASATSGNLSACSVTVTSGTILFDVGTLTVQNSVNVSGGTLTFENNASLYQVLDVANAPGVVSGGNSGNITYKRTTTGIRQFDYTYWSTPVNPQTLVNVSPNTPFDTYYYFDSSVNNWAYISSASLMDVGKGYIIRAPFNYDINTPAPYTASFIGTPNNGTITTPIVGGAAQMNLIGNPFASSVSASAFILDPANTNLNGTLYFWTHNTPINATYQYTGSDYAIYNLVGGTTAATNAGFGGGGSNAVPLGYIASGQGFFIKGFSSGTATFKNSMRAAGNNSQFYRLSPNTASTTEAELNLEKHRYWLDINNTEGAYKQALIGYVESATNGIDRLFDGEMVDIGNAITIYTIVDNTKLSIQGKQLAFDVNEMIPLGYKSTINSTYTISIPDFDGLFASQNIYLEDMLLNVIHDLKAAPYTFATESGTFDSRFRLRYTTNALGTDNPVFNQNTVVVYQNIEGLNINSGTENMVNVTIYDVRGREIASQKQIGNTTTVFTTLPTTQQVLLVKIEGENGGIVTKKVVY